MTISAHDHGNCELCDQLERELAEAREALVRCLREIQPHHIPGDVYTQAQAALAECAACQGSGEGPRVTYGRGDQDEGEMDTDCPMCGGTGAASESLSRDTEKALKEMEARKDAAYEERNRVVAALAWMATFMGWKAGTARTAIEGWSDDWHGCVYIDLPSGQVSWHYHDRHAAMFTYLPRYEGKWDGHTTEQKYSTLTALCSWRDSIAKERRESSSQGGEISGPETIYDSNGSPVGTEVRFTPAGESSQ